MVLYVGGETTIRRGGVGGVVFGVAQFECCIAASSVSRNVNSSNKQVE